MSLIRLFILAAIVLAVIPTSGCIRSKCVFTSNPSGAFVTVNHQPYGRTPVEVPFIWYWHYDVKVEKEGYQAVQADERFRTPIWAIFPLDLIAEAIPLPIPDTRYRHYELTRAVEE